MTEIPAKTPSPIGRTESFLPGSSNAAVVGETCSTAVPLASVVVELASGEVVAFGAAEVVAGGFAAVLEVVEAGAEEEEEALEEEVAVEEVVEELEVTVALVVEDVAVAVLDEAVGDRTMTGEEVEVEDEAVVVVLALVV